jgi:hypothetical protein
VVLPGLRECWFLLSRRERRWRKRSNRECRGPEIEKSDCSWKDYTSVSEADDTRNVFVRSTAGRDVGI